jgi:hypothetical protein
MPGNLEVERLSSPPDRFREAPPPPWLRQATALIDTHHFHSERAKKLQRKD